MVDEKIRRNEIPPDIPVDHWSNANAITASPMASNQYSYTQLLAYEEKRFSFPNATM
jgi:hypothetical protein